MIKRQVEIVVISDVHLGTYGCRAKELLRYLKSSQPEVLILNGDIIDIWQFSKSYWPEAHTKIIRQILKFVTKGTPFIILPATTTKCCAVLPISTSAVLN